MEHVMWDGQYHLINWVFLFFVYAILGWVWESIYMSFLERKPLNRGFLNGPCIPLYGFGATFVLSTTMSFKEHWWAVFLIGMISATILEEVTGRVMDVLFDVRYWTYEGYPGNIDDIICVPATILWGFFSVFAMYVLNRPAEYVMHLVPMIWLHRIVYACSLVFVIDATLTVKDALDFKELLDKVMYNRTELMRMKKRLDVMIAFYDADHKYDADMQAEEAEEPDGYYKYTNAVKRRLKIMREIYRLRKQENLEENEAELLEIDRMDEELKEQEVTHHVYGVKIRRYVKRILSVNPKARVIRIGVRIADVAGSVKQYIPRRKNKK